MRTTLHGCLPNTDYVELEARSGHRYGVWVTTPPGYAESDDALPVIVVLDGNWAVGLTAPLIVTQADPFLSVAPYIQVTVGFAGDEADDWAQLRNRDLVPPGEPVSEEMVATIRAAQERGAVTDREADAYLEALADTQADRFLAFLTDELIPTMHERYRVSETGHGLFGYSYGGLFALYAWLTSAAPFATFGAGSPGIASPDSRVFVLADDLDSPADEPTSPTLHVTVNEVEQLGDVPVYRRVALNLMRLVELLRDTGFTTSVTTALLHETHVTGLQASFLSYLKTSHSLPHRGTAGDAPRHAGGR